MSVDFAVGKKYFLVKERLILLVSNIDMDGDFGGQGQQT